MALQPPHPWFAPTVRSYEHINYDYEKYKLFDGFPFPTRQSISLGPMQVVIENSGFKVNQTIDPKWYKVK